MSWWVYLEDHEARPWCTYGTDFHDACPQPCYPAVIVPKFSEGGTQVLGGSTAAELNVTYNYSKLFTQIFSVLIPDYSGFKEWLTGKTGAEAGPLLAKAAARLGGEPTEDYWEPAPGNAAKALFILSEWAKLHPQAIFRVS